MDWQAENQAHVLMPNSSTQRGWHALVHLTSTFHAFYMPLHLGFGPSRDSSPALL